MKLRRHLTYANVISTVCLFLVLGGGAAFAATKLAKSSVGTEQLQGEAVTKGKLAPDSVNSKKVVNGSLTGEDIASSTLGKVPSASNAEHADSATTAGSANSASTATNASHATSADTAANAEKLDGHTPEELGAILIATPTSAQQISGEMYFSISGTLGFTHEFERAAVILPSHRFRATDLAVRLESEGSVTVNAGVSLVVNGVATEVCSVTAVPATCTPSLPAIEIPVGAQVAWKIATEAPVGIEPRFALRLGPA
jgi:hypothetical protein